MSKSIMEKMFDGITEEDITATIKTIIRIEKNLRGFDE
jgi:hypothetical protein